MLQSLLDRLAATILLTLKVWRLNPFSDSFQCSLLHEVIYGNKEMCQHFSPTAFFSKCHQKISVELNKWLYQCSHSCNRMDKLWRIRVVRIRNVHSTATEAKNNYSTTKYFRDKSFQCACTSLLDMLISALITRKPKRNVNKENSCDKKLTFTPCLKCYYVFKAMVWQTQMSILPKCCWMKTQLV